MCESRGMNAKDASELVSGSESSGFEFEEVNVSAAAPEHEEDEFAFSLFSGSAQKVTLKEEKEVIVNERPASYYRASYTPGEMSQFEQSAIGPDQIFRTITVDLWPNRVMSLAEHNKKVALANRKRRPGKKKREQTIKLRERRKQREMQRLDKHRGKFRPQRTPKKATKPKAPARFRTE